MSIFTRILSLRTKIAVFLFRIAQKVPGIHFYEYIVWERVCYIVNPKAASSSLRRAFMESALEPSVNNKSFREIRHFGSIKDVNRLPGIEFTFTVIRDPEKRIFSCWEQKVNRRDHAGFRFLNQYFFFYYPFIKFADPFSRFIAAVNRIPDRFSEKHFMSQCEVVGYGKIPYSKIYTLDKINEISNDLQRFIPGFSLGMLENVTGSNPSGLSEDTKEVIRVRYKRDFELYDTLSS